MTTEEIIEGLESIRNDYGCQSEIYDETVVENAIKLIKSQDEVIDALLKVGYPHDFQREPRWIVNYMYAITDVIKKAVKCG